MFIHGQFGLDGAVYMKANIIYYYLKYHDRGAA